MCMNIAVFEVALFCVELVAFDILFASVALVCRESTVNINDAIFFKLDNFFHFHLTFLVSWILSRNENGE